MGHHDGVSGTTGDTDAIADGADGNGGTGSEESRARRIRVFVEESTERGRAIADYVESIRPETPLIDTAFEAWERDRDAAGGLLGGALAFRLFLLSVPLVLLVYSALGFLHVSTGRAGDQADRVVPLSTSVISTMDRVGADAQHSRWVTLVIGLWALVLAMRTLVKTLRAVHVMAWDLPHRRRTGTVRAVLVGTGALAAALTAAAVGGWLRGRTPGGGMTISVVLGVLWGAGWLGVSVLLPRSDDAPWTALVPGAVVMGVATQGLHAASVFYLAGRVSRMSATYGPLGVAAVMLLWLYILARAAVAAAVLNSTLWDRHRRGLRSLSPVDVRAILANGDPGRDGPD